MYSPRLYADEGRMLDVEGAAARVVGAASGVGAWAASVWAAAGAWAEVCCQR